MNTITSAASAVTSPASTGIRPLVHALLATRPDWAPAVARVTLGAVMLPHGLQKTVGWFGGYGFEGTMGFFTGTMGIPWLLALGAILTESVGAVALILGLATRVQAALVGSVMAVAMVTVHWKHGFFMNWFGQQQGEGIEYFVLAIALAVVGMLAGGGKYSLDRLLVRDGTR